ncbi:DUF6544 family protein [Chamaesiphon minutus]|uniref:Uncharacterized protein n=1 Tax=Chamaesiphon minutus (strain ATCC 27169 / PCC 6605) TaxID=1173020 RepID=K9UPC2_CHAP6|nr:DUF6544 family protein [Chamaesiphon minutus]AFY96533.1 hypothetical protein Cha6605_5673 [Chamaesiphon minutus PCC 6605]
MTATTTITKTKEISIDELWESTAISERIFNPESIAHLPTAAQLYLNHAIVPGAKLASAVRLWMHGEIKLGQKWYHFTGEEVICWNRGMMWWATTWMQGLPIWGADSVVDGMSEVQRKMLGLFTVMEASGAGVTRSGKGRMQGESVWLPSVLCNPDLAWTEMDTEHVRANFTALGEQAELVLGVDRFGGLKRVKFLLWSNPEGREHQYVDFGGVVEANGTFGDYTIPTQLRLGWFFDSERFESEGEFFRCRIDNAIYR